MSKTDVLLNRAVWTWVKIHQKELQRTEPGVRILIKGIVAFAFASAISLAPPTGSGLFDAVVTGVLWIFLLVALVLAPYGAGIYIGSLLDAPADTYRPIRPGRIVTEPPTPTIH